MAFLVSFLNISHAQTTCVNYSNAQDAIGLYFPGRGAFYLSDPDNSQYTQVVNFGPQNANLIGLVGDWNKSGSDGVGYYDPSTSTFNLKYQAISGPADLSISFNAGLSGKLKPVVGDWTGKGYKSIGLYDGQGNFYLKNTNTPGASDIILNMGKNVQGIEANWVAVAGDWVGDGITRVGLYDPVYSKFYLNMSNDPNSNSQLTFRYGGFSNGLTPIMGKWTSSMTTVGAGLYSGGTVLEEYSLGPNASNPYGYASATVSVIPQGIPNAQLPQMIVGKWLPSQCLAAGQNTSPTSPSWMNGMILYELRIETFNGTTPGTFKAAATKLSYLSSLGITGIIITPVASTNSNSPNTQLQNFYGPSLPGVLDPRLGTDADFANFVSQAHALGIKVFADTVVHGITPTSPYLPGPVDGVTYNPLFAAGPLALPEDYFSHTSAGKIVKTFWGTAQWDWTSPGLRTWWINTIGIGWVQKYNIDGFRMDLEPAISGTILWNQLRSSVLAATGKQIALIPELSTAGRGYTFDTTQRSVGIGPFNDGQDFYDGPQNFVNFAQSSPENYYTYLISDHDNPTYMAQGRLSVFAYGALLSPLIPHWFAGEEFNGTPTFVGGTSPLYFAQINWAQQQQPANLAFFNEVQQLIQIRQAYKNILTPNVPLNKANITAVTSYSGTDLQPYSMWNGNSSITVVAKNKTPAGTVTLSIPVDTMGMSSFQFYNVTNLMNNTVSLSPRSSVVGGLTVNVSAGGVVPLKLDAVPLNSTVIGNIDQVLPNGDGSYAVKGWACSTGVDVPIQIQLYVGTGKTLYASGFSNLSSDPSVAAACGNIGNNFRFSLVLGVDAVTAYGGQPLVVEGVSPLGGYKPAVSNVQGYTVPFLPPSVPLGIAAGAGNNQIMLTWTAALRATSYNVGRSTVSGGPYTTIGAAVNPTYKDTSAINGTRYYYVVSAVNPNGHSANSPQVNATEELPSPSVPGGFSLTPRDAQVILSWSASTGAASYTIGRATVSGGPYATIAKGLTNTTYTDNSVTNGNAYYYVVSAVNASGQSGNSVELSTTPQPSPPTPIGLRATERYTAVILTLHPVLGATSYNVNRATVSGGPYTTIANVTTNHNIDTTISDPVPYYYVVSALNNYGQSANSTEVSLTPLFAPSSCKASAGNAQVKIIWDPSVGATSYNVERVSTGSTWAMLASSVNSTTYTDTTTNNGTSYGYYVVATNAAGYTANSAIVHAKPNPPPPPTPASFTAKAGDAQVTLTWNVSPGATGYMIKKYSNGVWTWVATSVTATSYTDTAVSNGTTYTYFLRAFNGGGVSLATAFAHATPKLPVPSVPSGLSASAGNAQVLLTWIASSGGVSYNVERSTVSGGPYATVANSITATTYTDNAVSHETTYYYVVSASNAGGQSPHSVEVQATLRCVAVTCTATQQCGSSTGIDNCGNTCATATPGTCSSPNTCGGGGVANTCGGSVNGTCSSSRFYTCSSGTPAAETLWTSGPYAGGYTWTCQGNAGGSSSGACFYCPASSTGVCGSSAPYTCTSGTPVAETHWSNGHYTWICQGATACGSNSGACIYN